MRNIGKIGRLSKGLRDALSIRIENGETGKDLVAWLNSNPHVQEVLARLFGGRPITEQNLSDWRQTGHLQWLRRQEARAATCQITDQAIDLDEETEDHNLSDRFATVLSSEITRLAMALLEPETDPEKRWRRLCQIHREISQMRRDDHRAMRAEIQRHRWEREIEREEEEAHQRQQEEHKKRMTEIVMSSMHNQAVAEGFGGGAHGQKMADLLHRIKFDLPLDDVLDENHPQPTKKSSEEKPANSQKSRPIAANRRQKIQTETEVDKGGGDGPSPDPDDQHPRQFQRVITN